MTHSIEDLLVVVYRYYPRGLHSFDPAYAASEEHRRLLAMRVEYGQGEKRAPWNAMVARLKQRLPGCSISDWTHLYPHDHDACYRVRVNLRPGDRAFAHDLVGLVSAIVPYYVVYSSSGLTAKGKGPPNIRYTFTPDEQPVLDILAGEIEATFGHARLPHEIGSLHVPDAGTWSCGIGKNTLYDFLFTETIW